MLLPLLFAVRCTSVNSMSPARSVAGLFLPVLRVDGTLFQVAFQVVQHNNNNNTRHKSLKQTPFLSNVLDK